MVCCLVALYIVSVTIFGGIYHCRVVLEDTHFETERLAIVYTCMHKQSTVHFVLILSLMNGGFMTASFIHLLSV